MARSGVPRLLTLLTAGALATVLTATPAAATSLAYRCRSALSKSEIGYANKRRDALATCARKLLQCEILLEVDGTNPTSCRMSAQDYCTDWLVPVTGKLALYASKADLRTQFYCEPFGLAGMLSNAAGGLWYANDPVCQSAADVASLAVCIRTRVEAEVDPDVSRMIPRAGLLLDNAGLGTTVPDLLRPPIQDLTITATAAGSGVLADPAPINVPVGTALRLSFDGATLPCGPSPNNGRVTITVGSQEFQVQETYGGTVTLGPWLSGSVPYTIELRDGGCSTSQSSVSGSITVS